MVRPRLADPAEGKAMGRTSKGLGGRTWVTCNRALQAEIDGEDRSGKPTG